jgi:hypothetical protein
MSGNETMLFSDLSILYFPGYVKGIKSNISLALGEVSHHNASYPVTNAALSAARRRFDALTPFPEIASHATQTSASPIRLCVGRCTPI